MDFLNFKAELTLVFFVALSGFCLPGPTDAMNGMYSWTKWNA